VSRRVVIVGAGVLGAATACFLARDHGCEVTLLERDTGFARASSSLSASSIRQQFSTAVNVALSRWSLDFLRRAAQELAVDGEGPALGLVEPGYLYLARADTQARLRAAHALQRAAGAEVALLEPAALRARFPWLRTDDLALGSLGLRGEGWFDGPALHRAFLRKARACGARLVRAEAVGFEARGARVLGVRLADGACVPAQDVVLCAGAWSAALAATLGLAWPVRARKRDVFVFDSPAVLPGCPLLIDPGGVWCRPEGRGYIAGAPPRALADGGPGDPDEPDLQAIDHALFEQVIWPALANRVPAFEALRLRSAWAGYYEMNDFDHNGLAGAVPGWAGLWTACGFSGHGMQQAPAVGCALATAIAGATGGADGRGGSCGSGRADAAPSPPSIEALSPQRLDRGERLVELNVI
jgi:glycine/D-amino acid oxidase-like deaminating enzyme